MGVLLKVRSLFLQLYSAVQRTPEYPWKLAHGNGKPVQVFRIGAYKKSQMPGTGRT
jgi:hypothetical protein